MKKILIETNDSFLIVDIDSIAFIEFIKSDIDENKNRVKVIFKIKDSDYDVYRSIEGYVSIEACNLILHNYI